MSSLLVPFAATSVSLVRHRCVDELRGRGISPVTIDDTALVLSELVGNAVRHGQPLDGSSIEVRWEISQTTVRLEVRDGGRGPLKHEAGLPVRGSADAEGGRGLAIVAMLTGSWGSAFDAEEAVVWADIPIAGVGVQAWSDERQEA
jgi:anti-sigma regulatory factor (Ser/Thr protein kinase)